MPDIHPFVGLLYDSGAGRLDDLTAPPYDVITPMDRRRLHAKSPYNVVRLTLGEDRADDGPRQNRYTRAFEAFEAWRGAGVLRPTAEQRLFPYEVAFTWQGTRRRIRGVIAELRLESWGGAIVPHERTMPGPLEDRLALLRAVPANLSPIYGVLPSRAPAMGRYLERATADEPLGEVVDEAGTRHRLWASAPEDAVLREVGEIPMMIADGHHRYTVALAYRDEMRELAGPGPWDRIMAFVVDAATEQPPVLPIHRVLARDVPDTEGDSTRVRDLAEVLAGLRDVDRTYGVVRLEDGQPIHRVARLSAPPPTVCALHDELLDRVPLEDVRFVADAARAEAAVTGGAAAVAYFLPPTRVEDVWRTVRSGRRLPEKSTYFWPKPRTGMVIRPLER